MILPSRRKHLCLSAGKNSTLSPILLWKYCKDMQTYFGYSGHARKNFSKNQKKHLLEPFWVLFEQIRAKNEFPGKRTLSVFQYSNFLPLCQKSGKPNEPFLRKLLDGHIKNQFISLTSLWDTANFRVLQLIQKSCDPDWPRTFWTISQKPDISQIWNLLKHTTITVIQTFIIDQIDKKVKNWEKS